MINLSKTVQTCETCHLKKSKFVKNISKLESASHFIKEGRATKFRIRVPRGQPSARVDRYILVLGKQSIEVFDLGWNRSSNEYVKARLLYNDYIILVIYSLCKHMFYCYIFVR